MLGSVFESLSKNIQPIQQNVGKAIVDAETSLLNAVGSAKDAKTQQKIQGKHLCLFPPFFL